MNKKVKILLIVLLTAIIILMFTTNIFAEFKPTDWEPTVKKATELNKKGGAIVGIIQVIGQVVSIMALVLLGIKYMVGSIEERAEYKKSMFPYLIGAMMVFLVSTLTNVIYKLASGIWR